MQVSIEKVSNIERRLTIVVPSERVEEAYNKQINLFAKNANIKGFRPGKAPITYIRQRFGEEARSKALSEVIEETLYKAIAEHKLRPVSTPKIEPKVLALDQPLEYMASFEVLPEIGEIKFSKEAVDKYEVEINEEDITQVINQLLKQHTKWNVIDRAAEKSDRMIIDYYAIYDEKTDEENKVQDFTLELGSNVMIPGFEEGLIGAKPTEERTLNLQFPADIKDKEKAGKNVKFVVKIKQLFAADIPSLDEKLIKLLGVASGKEVDLREQITKTLNQERERLINEKLKEQVFSELLEQNPIELPPSLVAKEAQKIHDEIYQRREHDHHQHSEAEFATFNSIAQKRVALGLLINEYANQKNLNIDKERVQKRIKDIASLYEHPQEVISYLSSHAERSGIEAQVMEEQVLDSLLNGVTQHPKKISYAELKGIRI